MIGFRDRRGLIALALSAFTVSACFSGIALGVPSWLETGAWFLGKGDYDRARFIFLRELELHSYNVEAAIRLADVELLSSGRESAHSLLLEYAKDHWRSLSPEARAQLRGYTRKVQSMFLGDAAQTAYLQSQTLLKNSDCAAISATLRNAQWLEPDNLAILELRLECAQRTRDTALRLELLGERLAMHPWERQVREDLVLVAASAADYRQAVEVFQSAYEPLNGALARTAYAVALVEVGKGSEAIPILRDLLRGGNTPLPVVQFYLAQALNDTRSGTRAEMSNLLRRFLASFEPVGPSPTDAFHSVEKVPAARKLLSQIWNS